MYVRARAVRLELAAEGLVGSRQTDTYIYIYVCVRVYVYIYVLLHMCLLIYHTLLLVVMAVMVVLDPLGRIDCCIAATDATRHSESLCDSVIVADSWI